MTTKHSTILLATLGLAATARSHLLINYPGSRGYDLAKNGTVSETNGLSVATSNGTDDPLYPYGMQFVYPCGGLPITQNRSTWPINGGPLSFQPGLQAGHSSALLYVNLGLGTMPPNYSLPMVHVFSIEGPTNDEYHDGICLPSVPLPQGVSVQPGDNATIQIVEAAQHGASLYTCVDITFVPEEETPMRSDIACSNSSSISFSSVSTGNKKAWYSAGQMIALGLGTGLPLLIAVAALSFFLWKARKQLKEQRVDGKRPAAYAMKQR